MDRAAASAPASIGNVGVGFDILGHAFDAARDHVVAERSGPGVRLGSVTGLVTELPETPEANTALAAAAALLKAAGDPFGVVLSIDKGVPLAAGMGGSAASAVAAGMAVNALLGAPFTTEALLPFAIEGERAACDPPPWDNVMASLLGGLVLAARRAPPLLARLPVPPGIVAVLLHPAARTETRHARALLANEVPFTAHVEHGRRLAAFVAGCLQGDVDLVRVGLEDLVVEPQRSHLLAPFHAVKEAALGAGALGCSFSGSGPSMFAWVEEDKASAVEQAMSAAFAAAGMSADAYRASPRSQGARLE